MYKFFSVFLMILGGIFLILLLIGAGYWISLSRQTSIETNAPRTPTTNTTETASSTTTESEQGTSFVLTDAQKSALSSFGIDPTTVPSTITAEQEACFNAKLGTARVTEIKGGATPSAIDFFKVKSCL